MIRYIKQFDDVCTIAALGMDLLPENSDIKRAFHLRGQEFVKLKGVHYMEYHDNLVKRDNWGHILKFRVTSLILLSAWLSFLSFSFTGPSVQYISN